MNKPSYYGILPANVRYDKTLKPMEKILYVEVTSLLNMNGKCEASNSYFAELYDVSIETVSRWVSNLCKQEYFTTTLKYKKGTKEVEKRTIDLNINTPRQKSQEGIDEKVKDIINPTDSLNIKVYKDFLIQLKEQVKYKSKVTKTKEGGTLFKSIEDKNKLINDYIKHQQDKGEFAQRITAFMEDYQPQADIIVSAGTSSPTAMAAIKSITEKYK